MASLFSENRQVMIHVAAEIAVIGSVAFFFHKKTKSLQRQLNELHQQVQSQQTLIEQHDQVLRNIVRNMSTSTNNTKPPTPRPSSPNATQPQEVVDKQPVSELVETPTLVEDTSSDTHSETGSDLDAELTEELADLIELPKE